MSELAVVIPSKGEQDPLGFVRCPQKLNLGMVGSDVFLTYKLSPKSINRASYRADLLARLPKDDHADIPMAPWLNSVPNGCVRLTSKITKRVPRPRHENRYQ